MFHDNAIKLSKEIMVIAVSFGNCFSFSTYNEQYNYLLKLVCTDSPIE